MQDGYQNAGEETVRSNTRQSICSPCFPAVFEADIIVRLRRWVYNYLAAIQDLSKSSTLHAQLEPIVSLPYLSVRC